MSKKTVLITLFIGLTALFTSPLLTAIQGRERTFTFGDAYTLHSEQTVIPEICERIDYLYAGPTYKGWPFGVIESVNDECGAYYNNPNNSTKIYPMSGLANMIVAANITLGLAFTTVIVKEIKG